MESLFITGPVYDKHITSIINQMLQKLRNNKPRSDSKCYITTANYIQELYSGTYLYHQFDDTNDSQYNLDGWIDKIKSCIGDWQTTRTLIMSSIDNIEKAKDKSKLPFNKKYVESITFSTFFEGSTFNMDGKINSNFIKFLNEPKPCYNFVSDKTIEKLKSGIPEYIKTPAEIFARKYFRVKKRELSFWYNISDWIRWLNCFKKTFPKIYSEFISCCSDGNPFIDFKVYLINLLKRKEGEHFIMEETNFQLSMQGSHCLEGYFRTWLRSGIDSNKFNILKQLPKSIDEYYSDDSWVSPVEKIVEKKVVELEDIIF